MTTNPVRWFEIYVQDLARAQAFYEAVFEIKLEPIQSAAGLELRAFPMAAERPGSAGALAKMKGVPSGGSSTLVYFSCADCAREEVRAREFGGRVHQPKTGIGEYGYFSLVIDTEGNMIGLHSME